MHSLLRSLGTLRAPIFVAVLAVVVLAVPDQTHELFEAIGQEEGRFFFGEFLRALIFVLIFGLTLLLTSIKLLQTATPYRHDAVLLHRRSVEALALALPLSILLGLAVAVVGNATASAIERPTEAEVWLGGHVLWERLLLGGIAATFLASFPLFFRLENLRHQITSCGRGLFLFHVPMWASVSLFILAVALLNAAILFYPRAISYLFGPLGVLFVFFSILCITLALLGYVYDRFGWPVIGMLVVGAFVWAYFPTNDNHYIRLSEDDDKPKAAAAEAFKDWLRQRPDRTDAQFKDRPYPVYIVTAEGGGLYAAAHAAWTLATIQDHCPAFARHVFAISGVSGGSLGAALFAALVKAHPPKEKMAGDECQAERNELGPAQKGVERFFSNDLLTPLLATALFPDFVQRFLPVGIGAFDRARALEDAFEQAWRVTAKDKPGVEKLFSGTVRELWSTGEDQPALLLNTTHVQTGGRIIISPFKLRETKFYPFADPYVDRLNLDDAPLLKTAVSISARFPLITPPGLYNKSGIPFQMADGGYYESTGIFTAINLIDLVHTIDASQPSSTGDSKVDNTGNCGVNNSLKVKVTEIETIAVCLKIIIIRRWPSARQHRHSGDLLSLVSAVYNARTAKGAANLSLANKLYCGGERCGQGTAATDANIYMKYLDANAMGLALGWYLSDGALKSVFTPFPSTQGNCFAERVGKRTGFFPLGREVAVPEENGCLLPRIIRDLAGR